MNLHRDWYQHPLFISALIHFGLAFIILLLIQIKFLTHKSHKIEFTVYKKQTPVQLQNKPLEIQSQNIKKQDNSKANSHRVFGLSRKALTSTESLKSDVGVIVKEGNTLTKAPDQEKLNPDDADSLPIPTDDFLVTSMPVKLFEIQIPYPKQAQDAKIEGPVVMDLLIDENGVVRSSQLVKGSGFGLDEAALEAVYKFKFQPAKVDNKPVVVKIRYTYRFVLQSK